MVTFQLVFGESSYHNRLLTINNDNKKYGTFDNDCLRGEVEMVVDYDAFKS